MTKIQPHNNFYEGSNQKENQTSNNKTDISKIEENNNTYNQLIIQI